MRSDVVAQATLRYHAGELTLAEWSACVREFMGPDAQRPAAPQRDGGPQHPR